MSIMNRLAPFVVVGLLMAACDDSIDSSRQSPGGSAGIDSSAATELVDAVVDAGEASSTTELSGSEPAAVDTEVSEPDPTNPPSTEATQTAGDSADIEVVDLGEPTSLVARFFAGGNSFGSPWVPIGAWDGSVWLSPVFAENGDLLPFPEADIATVSVSSLDLPDGLDAVVTGLGLGDEAEYCVGSESGPLIELPNDIPDSMFTIGYDAIAVTAGWPLQPRPVRQVGLEVPEYQEIGTQLFDQQLVATAAQGSVVQAVRADLDGDGIEEVLVTYERQASPDFGAEGDFSGVYARYPAADGTVENQLVVGYESSEPVDFPTPGRHTLAAVADLNGDGSMEVMVRSRFWESGGMQVFSLVDGRLTEVAGGGCGV